MTVDEAARLRLYEKARSEWGGDAAGTLMGALPRDTDQSATKGDLAVSTSELRTEMAELRTELRTGLAEVRAEIKATAAELTRTLMFGMIASNATLVGLVFAAVKLA